MMPSFHTIHPALRDVVTESRTCCDHIDSNCTSHLHHVSIPVPELIITFGHRSNDREFTSRDRVLVSANGQVWPDINALVEMSLSVVPQRWLNNRSRRQRGKNGKKKTIWSIRRYHGYAMPKEPTWSLSIAQYVGSTKLTYDR